MLYMFKEYWLELHCAWLSIKDPRWKLSRISPDEGKKHSTGSKCVEYN